MKKLFVLLCAVLALSLLLTSCGDKPEDAAPSESDVPADSIPTDPEEIKAHNEEIDEASINLIQFDTPAAGTKVATIKTSAGDIKIALYDKEAPKAVENWIALAEKGYYNGLKFYEVIPTVRISTGDPENSGNGGESSFDSGKFADEYSLNLWHFNGAVAMNNNGVSDANDSKFYIIQNNGISEELGQEMIDGGFPTKVIDKYLEVGGVPNYDFKDTVFGQVIEGMDVVEQIASAARDEQNKPSEDITIDSITIETL